MTILLHSCCGVCLGGAYPLLEQVTGPDNTAVFWENPNIHPFVEYHNRLDSLKKMAAIYGLEVLYGDTTYGLDRFLHELQGNFGPERCGKCYALRLAAVAKEAAAKSFAAFSTTLLISPYQNHELLIKIGNEIGKKVGVTFHYTDLRPAFKSTYEIARQNELYRQKYCGCIFSEHDRYKNDRKYLNPQAAKVVESK